MDTARLTLIPCIPEHLLTLIDHPERFQSVTGMVAGNGLRDFFLSDDVSAEWTATLRAGSRADPWRYGFFVLHRETGLVIGSAGFKGPPDEVGAVEIAYGIVPDFEGQGHATETAAALVNFAIKTNGVRLIRAHTLPVSSASTRVLSKCGFNLVSTVNDPEDGLVWRWERVPPNPASH